MRTTLSDSHTPISMALEDHYYPSVADFCDAAAKAFYSKYFVSTPTQPVSPGHCRDFAARTCFPYWRVLFYLWV